MVILPVNTCPSVAMTTTAPWMYTSAIARQASFSLASPRSSPKSGRCPVTFSMFVFGDQQVEYYSYIYSSNSSEGRYTYRLEWVSRKDHVDRLLHLNPVLHARFELSSSFPPGFNMRKVRARQVHAKGLNLVQNPGHNMVCRVSGFCHGSVVW